MNKNVIATIIGSAVIAGSLAACSSNDDEYYRPVAFGEKHKCYYVQTRAEAEMLKREGFCAKSDIIVIAPVYWVNMYSGYYFSAAYRNHFVPKAKRNSYKTAGIAYVKVHKTDIKKAESKAKYSNGSGNVVPGNKVNMNKLGTSKTKTCASGLLEVVVAKGSGGSSGSRGGSSGSRSGSGSGSGSGKSNSSSSGGGFGKSSKVC